MVNPQIRFTSIPTIAEKGTGRDGVDLAGAALAYIPVLQNIACAHARVIEVFIWLPVNVRRVLLRNYANSRLMYIDNVLANNVGPSPAPVNPPGLLYYNALTYSFTGTMGHTYDLYIQHDTTPHGAGTIAYAWTAAKN